MQQLFRRKEKCGGLELSIVKQKRPCFVGKAAPRTSWRVPDQYFPGSHLLAGERYKYLCGGSIAIIDQLFDNRPFAVSGGFKTLESSAIYGMKGYWCR